jgi:hypothetical protein
MLNSKNVDLVNQLERNKQDISGIWSVYCKISPCCSISKISVSFLGGKFFMSILFAKVPDSSINSWESWFIFNLRKINTNQSYESDSLNVGNCSILREYMTLRDNEHTMITCTYLNSHLLEAPREYVLHGLVPGLNWAPFWPLPLSMHLVATPNPVSCCLLCWVGFHA